MVIEHLPITGLSTLHLRNYHTQSKNHERQVKHELFQLCRPLAYDKTDVEFTTLERQKILSSSDHLKNYMYNLLQLHSSKETLKARLSSLYAARIKNQAEINIINSKPLIERKERIVADTERFEKAQKVYLQSVAFADSCKANRSKPAQLPMPPKPIEPIYQKPNLFIAQPLFMTLGLGSSPDPNIYYRTRNQSVPPKSVARFLQCAPQASTLKYIRRGRDCGDWEGFRGGENCK